VSDNRCHGIETTPFGSGRMVSGCPRPVLSGKDLCQLHQDQADYQQREFKRQMLHSTRHSGGIAFHGKGTQCSCGVFVKEGELHPWRVPRIVEEYLEELVALRGYDSFTPAQREAIDALRRGSNHVLLDNFAEECSKLG
jgi:hypothetical protein